MKLLTSGHVMTSEGGWVHRIHNVSDRFLHFQSILRWLGAGVFQN